MLRPVRGLRPLLLALLLPLLPAASAAAFQGHVLGSMFGPEGPGAGAFTEVQSLAVDQASGDVYVYDDSGTGAVYRFNAAGERVSFSGLGTNALTGVGVAGTSEEELAVDSSSGPDRGDLYVANNSEVRIYNDSTGQLLGSITGGESCGVAVDSSGEVYVGFYGSTIKKYTPTTNPVSNADYTSSLNGLEGVCDVAADTEGNAYADTWDQGPVRKYAASQFNTTEETALTTPPDTTFDDRGSTLAVNQATDELYIDELEGLAQYSSSGALLSRFGEAGAGAITHSRGVAVNSATGAVYASSGAGKINIYVPQAVPTTHTGAPSGIVGFSGTLHGDVEDPSSVAGGVGYYFSYDAGSSCVGSGALTTPRDNGAGNATGSGDVAEEAMLTGLRAHTQYTVCFVTTSAAGSTFGQPVELLTAAAAPFIESETSTAVEQSTATLEAQVNPEKEATTCLFQYVTQQEFSASGYASAKSAACEPASFGESGEAVSGMVDLTALAPATIYHYRVLASNATGETTGADETFTTLPLAPEASTGQAAFAASGEELAGAVNPRGNGIWESTYYIEYGLTAAYGSQIQGSAGAGDSAVAVSGALSELPAGVYHYRISAKNAGGEGFGADGTFTVVGGGPLVGTETAQFVNEGSAVIVAALNPQGSLTSYEVQYGTSAAYGSSTAPLEMVAATSSQGTITEIAGLLPGTTYHYRLVATSAAGTAYGQDATLTTTGATPTTAFTSFAIPTAPQIEVTPFTLPGETRASTKAAAKKTTKPAKRAKSRGKRKRKKPAKRARKPSRSGKGLHVLRAK
jgi:hypothetical protein